MAKSALRQQRVGGNLQPAVEGPDHGVYAIPTIWGVDPLGRQGRVRVVALGTLVKKKYEDLLNASISHVDYYSSFRNVYDYNGNFVYSILPGCH